MGQAITNEISVKGYFVSFDVMLRRTHHLLFLPKTFDQNLITRRQTHLNWGPFCKATSLSSSKMSMSMGLEGNSRLWVKMQQGLSVILGWLPPGRVAEEGQARYTRSCWTWQLRTSGGRCEVSHTQDTSHRRCRGSGCAPDGVAHCWKAPFLPVCRQQPLPILDIFLKKTL